MLTCCRPAQRLGGTSHYEGSTPDRGGKLNPMFTKSDTHSGFMCHCFHLIVGRPGRVSLCKGTNYTRLRKALSPKVVRAAKTFYKTLECVCSFHLQLRAICLIDVLHQMKEKMTGFVVVFLKIDYLLWDRQQASVSLYWGFCVVSFPEGLRGSQ